MSGSATAAAGKCFEIRVSLWNNERSINLDFPPEWEAIECPMAGHDLPPLSNAQITEAFENPIGSLKIRDLARGKQKVVILFDDVSRPTPVQTILPFVFKELEAGGVGADKIRLVCASGCHRPLSRQEFTAKLGREIVENYMVFNHNVYEHLVNMGTTSRGTPVMINREVAGCDLKIGIGSIIPHPNAGFAGGAKILLPGVSSIDSVAHNHVNFNQRKYPDVVGIGKVNKNHRRLDMEEAARLAGLDVVVNTTINHKKEILGMFVGDFVEAHRAGTAAGKKIYLTESKGKFDILVLNTFPIEETPGKALWAAKEALKEGGDIVLVWQTEDGMVPHFLQGTFGSDYGGLDWHKPGPLRTSQAKRLYIYAENLSKQDRLWWGPEDQVFWFRDWQKLIAALKVRHGAGTRVGLYPYCTLQCPPLPDEE